MEPKGDAVRDPSDENAPVRTPFFLLGSLQLTFSDVSRISVKLR